jgi:hypothetical protein
VCLRKLWDNVSPSKPLSVKSMSGRECSLLWDKSTIRRPDVDLNSSVGMLVSWLCERSNTCKQVFIQLSCILCTECLKWRSEIAEWILSVVLSVVLEMYRKGNWTNLHWSVAVFSSVSGPYYLKLKSDFKMVLVI